MKLLKIIFLFFLVIPISLSFTFNEDFECADYNNTAVTISTLTNTLKESNINFDCTYNWDWFKTLSGSPNFDGTEIINLTTGFYKTGKELRINTPLLRGESSYILHEFSENIELYWNSNFSFWGNYTDQDGADNYLWTVIFLNSNNECEMILCSDSNCAGNGYVDVCSSNVRYNKTNLGRISIPIVRRTNISHYLANIDRFVIEQRTTGNDNNVNMYIDDIQIDNYGSQGDNTIPNVTLNVSPKVKCLNKSFLDTVSFDLDINATDLEGDTLYYSIDEKGYDKGIFGLEYNVEANYYAVGNKDVRPYKHKNQTWGEGLTQQEIGGNFTNKGVLTFNEQTFPSDLPTEQKGITYEVDPLDVNPRIFFKLYWNNLAQFEIKVMDGFFTEMFMFNISDTGLPQSRANATSNIGAIFNETYGHMTQFLMNFSDTELKLYVCDPYLGCNEENPSEYTLVNVTNIGTSKYKYIRFTIDNGGIFLDDFFLTYEQSIPQSWSTTKPTTVSYNYPGIFRYKIYVTDEVHKGSSFSSDYQYLEVKKCSEYITDIQDQKVKTVIKFFKDKIGFFFKAAGEDTSITVIWLTFFMLSLSGIIGMYKITQRVILTTPILIAALFCGFISFLGSLTGTMISFLIIIGMTIATPMAKNFIGGENL